MLGYKVKRAVDLGAALTIVADGPNTLDPWAQKHLPMSELSEVATLVAAAVRPVVLYAAFLPSDAYAFLRTLPEKTRYLPLVEGANALGAAQMGIKTRAVSGDALYVLAADEVKDGHQLPEAAFTVVQAAYWTPTAEQADVVLPALDLDRAAGARHQHGRLEPASSAFPAAARRRAGGRRDPGRPGDPAAARRRRGRRAEWLRMESLR